MKHYQNYQNRPHSINNEKLENLKKYDYLIDIDYDEQKQEELNKNVRVIKINLKSPNPVCNDQI